MGAVGVTSYDVVEAQSFWDCVLSLRNDDRYRADLLDTMLELRAAPFQNPILQSHKVGKAKNGRDIWSSDVGGRKSDRRVIWQLLGNTVVLLLYGTHAVQERAKRMRIDFDEVDRVVTIFEEAPDDRLQERPYQVQRQVVGRLFMAWTDDELRALGFSDHLVPILRRLDTDDDLMVLDGEMARDDFTRAFNLVAYGHPDGERAVPVAEFEVVPDESASPATDAERDLEAQLQDRRGGAWFTRTEPEYLREVLDAPIEDWMVFLHPDQRAAAERRYDGPARIRGAAGTGKTVVALHRTAELARRAGDGQRVLFLTVSDSLVPVMRHLFLRMKDAPADRVDFRSVGELASSVLAEAGVERSADQDRARQAFEVAYDEVVVPGSPLAQGGLTRDYLRTEIEYVVRGRAAASVDEYLELERRGRRVGLTERMRREVFRLHENWLEHQQRSGAHLPVDLALAALAVPEPGVRWAHAVVDEAQDLSMAAFRLLERVVPIRKPDGLLLAGDGAQKVFSGGFSLAQAGLEVRGRTTILRVNYRSTKEIMDLALTVAGADEVVDLDEHFRRGEVAPDTARRGDPPLLLIADGRAAEIAGVVAQVERLQATDRVALGDIAVLERDAPLADEIAEALADAGWSVQPLQEYDGRTNDAVKVGTWPGAKGLEFKAVILPGLSAAAVPAPRQPNETAEEHEERAGLELSRLFVAMTRARDALILTSAGKPSLILDVDERLLRRRSP